MTPAGADELLIQCMGRLSFPILRTYYVKRCAQAEKFPDARETALAQHTDLIFSTIAQKAAMKYANIETCSLFV